MLKRNVPEKTTIQHVMLKCSLLEAVTTTFPELDLTNCLQFTKIIKTKTTKETMGDTYGFCKVRRKVFLSGKSRFIMGSDGLDIVDDNPNYIDIVGDLDREDYLYRLVKPKDGEIECKDAELANYIKNAYPRDEQAIVVTLESVNRAIEVLVNLDKKVASMPCDKKSEANVIYKDYLEPYGTWKYVEDKPRDPEDPWEKVYVSSCKENVDIYKEVEKVYGHRTYHYGFPWRNKGWNPGASYIIEALMTVKNEMEKPENKDYVFLFTWI